MFKEAKTVLSRDFNREVFKNQISAASPDSRAVCIDQFFFIGFNHPVSEEGSTKRNSEDLLKTWRKILKESREHLDIVIVPYLDSGGR